MRRNLASFLLLISLVITACGQATIPPATLPPTKTHTPAPTSTVSSTPFPPLSGNKPYLMLYQSYPDKKIFIYDADGRGRKMVELPIGGNGYTSISPDGKWFAFYTGNYGRDADISFPITLNLLNIESGKVKKVSDIVMQDYEQKLSAVTNQLKALFPENYKPDGDLDWANGSVISAFEQRIYSNAWSPDSHSLAFAGQIDGISSDVYLYDIESDAIQRVNDDIENVWSIRWSPDGKKIVFENSIPGEIYTGSTLHIAEPGKEVIKDPKVFYSGTWLAVGKWLSPSLLLVSDGTDTAGNFNLQTLNINTGQLTELWRDAVSDYVIDYKNRIIALNSSEFAKPENRGLYFITFGGQRTRVLDGIYYMTSFFRGGDRHRFLVVGVGKGKPYDLEGDAVGIDLEGKPTFLGKFNYQQISISPDYSWLLMFNEQSLYLYDKHDELVKTFPIAGINEIIWRPDSKAIFYSTENALYYLSIPAGQPKLVDKCGRACSFYLKDAVWLP